MSFNSVGQYTASHKSWDHIGNLIATVEHSEGVRPHAELMPAAWLPVRFYEKYFENWITVMPGKLVALDNDGRVVPAQYGLTSAQITYTATDVTEGVIDVRTGAALLTANIGTFNVSAVTSHMGRGEGALAVSRPIGVCTYPYLQWAGTGATGDDGFNPIYYRQHNYNMQHRVAVVCDYILELPVVPAATSSANLTEDSFSGTVETFAALSNLPVAANTVRTPITFANGTLTDAATVFVNQVDALTDIKSSGDWHINLATGVISAYRASAAGGGNVYTVSYYNYASAPTGSNVSVFASALGDLKPGDLLKCNADSNWVVATPKTYGVADGNNFDTFADIMGQVLDVETQPKDMLDKVRTAYNALSTSSAGALPGTAGQMDQMPGSATGGVSDKVHYAGAANKVVRVNLVSR